MEKYNKHLRVLLLLILSMYFGIKISSGQISKNYIYAKVITKDSSTFEGFVKFGRRTFLWSDFFKLDKLENPYAQYIPIGKKKVIQYEISDDDSFFRKDSRKLTVHEFTVRLGYIKSMEFHDNRYISLELKDEKYINLRSSYFHRDLDIEITDKEFGRLKLDASQLERIEFMSAPDNLEITMSAPIYGTVLTKQGEFTGFVCWDKDEIDEDDLLDGDWGRKGVSIYFKNIASIEKLNNCCNVITRSGVSIELCGSNDVNRSNRGVIVNMPNVGELTIDWRDFESLQLNHSFDNIGLAYDDYKPAERLRGDVILKDGSIHSGIIVYDLDEAMTIENIDGKNAGLAFKIPFLNIKSITPKSLKYSKIVLTNGISLLLGKLQDVNYKNDGILIFTETGDREFFQWVEIKNINFR
jgi:hypothetical protein